MRNAPREFLLAERFAATRQGVLASAGMSRPRFKFTSSGKGIPRWLGWIPLALGVAFLLSLFYYEGRIVLLGRPATGEITKRERRGRSIILTVSYQTATGQPAQFRQTLLMREPLALGQRVNLRYLPGDLSLGRIETFWQLWLPFVTKILLGPALLAAGAGILRHKFFGLTEPHSKTRIY
jgi:hypothetical protein